jgi:hypothetical protein
MRAARSSGQTAPSPAQSPASFGRPPSLPALLLLLLLLSILLRFAFFASATLAFAISHRLLLLRTYLLHHVDPSFFPGCCDIMTLLHLSRSLSLSTIIIISIIVVI